MNQPSRRPPIKRLISRAVRYLPHTPPTDRLVSWVHFVLQHDRIPSSRHPLLYNDRLFQLKIDGTLADPLRQFVSDKEYVKQYICGVVGPEYVLRTYDILRNHEDVDQLRLTRFPCVVKPTHLSGPVLFCTDPTTPIDRGLMKRWLGANYYRHSREKNYKYLRPKIIVEEFFSEDGRTPPHDYKVFCFHGRPKIIQVDSGRFQGHTRNFYDTSWNSLSVTVKYPAKTPGDDRPADLGLMLDVARQLSRAFPSIRVDMYTIDRHVKVGELTNCPDGGSGKVLPADAEVWLGALFEK